MSNLFNCSRAKNHGLGRDTALCPRKTSFYLLLSGVAFAFLFSCGPSREEKQLQEKSALISQTLDLEYPGLQTDSLQGHNFNFMRCADMKLQVENVLNSSNLIESLVENAGGYVSRSEMRSEILSKNSARVQKDSVLESSMYLTKNSLTLRVPAARFDTILREITSLSLFLDQIDKTTEDVKTMIYAKTVQREHLKDFANSIEKKAESPAKLKDFVNAREVVLEKRLSAENKDIEAYILSEKVNFSTLNVELYQAVQVKNSMLVLIPEMPSYEIPFTEQVISSVKNGFGVIKKTLLFFLNNWGILCISLLGYLVFMKIRSLKRNFTF